MRAIWKFPLGEPEFVSDGVFEREIDIPDGARILHVAIQKGSLCLWGLVDPKANKVPAKLKIYGTGRVVESDSRLAEDLLHLGTVMTEDHSFVWHVFLDVSERRVLALEKS